MVCSHWLTQGPEPGPDTGPILCRTFHTTPGPGPESTPENACLHALNKDPNKTCAFVMLFKLRRNVVIANYWHEIHKKRFFTWKNVVGSQPLHNCM